MKNKLVTAYTLLAVTFFISCSLLGMEKKSIVTKSFYDNDMTIPKVYDKRSLENTIKINLDLIEKLSPNMANEHCKNVGHYCKSLFEFTEKNQAMVNLLSCMNDTNYWDKRPEALILVYAGVRNNIHSNGFCSLLKQACLMGDKELLKVLFESGVDPRQQEIVGWCDNEKVCDEVADWFWSKDIETVKTFMEHGVDLNTGGTDYYPNVLWFALEKCSAELVLFYLNNKVSTKGIAGRYQGCIWHHYIDCREKFFVRAHNAIGGLLAEKALDMINTKNKFGQTPLAYACMEKEEFQKADIDLFTDDWKSLISIINLLNVFRAEKQ